MKIEQFSRLINHRVTTAGTQFTIPTSNDHTDETWLATDLYIGEIGINVTDDTIYMRTNNGIIQISTGTSSGSTGSSAIFVYNSPNIEIGSTYSADALTRRSGYYTDLGSSALRWKDLYLGGSSGGYAVVDANGGLHITEASDGILTTNAIVADNSPIEMGYSSANVNKDRVLWLNTRRGSATGSTNYIGAINSDTITFTDNSRYTFISSRNAFIDDSVTDGVHLGRGYNKVNYESNQVVVGGSLAVRGGADDGSGQYSRADWTTSQAILRTSDALTTNIVSIPWTATASGGDVIQIKGYIIGTDISDATKVYSAEIMGVYSLDGNLTVTEVGTPILNAVSSYSGDQPDCEMSADGSNVYIKVTGVGTDTIQWLCSYSYHRLINVIP